MSSPPFSEVLQSMRKRQRMSQARLAQQSRHDHSSISRLESGDRVPSREMVLQLSHAMGLNVVDRAELMAAAGFLDAIVPASMVRAVAQLVTDEREYVILPVVALADGVYGFVDGDGHP